MKILVDTSVIVEIDRGNESVTSLLKSLVKANTELVISTVTVSEILAGSYLTKDVRKAVMTAKEVLNQFLWVDLDGEVAEKTAQLLAYLLSEKRTIEYQDIVIAATFFTTRSDYLLTLNRKDFLAIPALNKKVYAPDEFRKIIKMH
ncbi:MAG: type II toxin-antitoxin system VapC family toxin [Candidatus Aenigmarchaeota archaeon]|nr:type II toxin-antitoxin system VapC family toxin [Candidatus Aenigmarchaeota archaeon]